jgi:hypothetical protein
MTAAMKRAAAKGKNPDFDRTLSNFVRKQQQSGHEIKDEDIMDQARLFARASGTTAQQDGLLGSLTSSWLHKFKQKHGLGGSGSGSGSGGSGGRLIRRASEANIPDSARMSTVRRPSVKKAKRKNTPAGQAVLAPKTESRPVTTGLGIGIISPTSPTQMSPLSETKSDEEAHASDPFDIDFTYNRPTASQSAHDLTSDNMDSSFSGALSPAGTLAFSPDPNSGAFQVEQTIDPRNGVVVGSEFQHLHREKRSNTFPSLNIDAATTSRRTTDSPVSALGRQQHPSSHSLESPDQDISADKYFALDTTLASPPKLRRSGSNSSIAAARSAAATPAPNSAVTTSSVAASVSLESLSSIMSSPPVSPSQEDARRAANTLLSYMQGQGQQFEQSEYMALVHLTKKLQVHQLQMQQQQQQQQQQQPQIQHRPSIGGLSRIPEGDTEMTQAPELVMETG